jgi:hypothetical protein
VPRGVVLKMEANGRSSTNHDMKPLQFSNWPRPPSRAEYPGNFLRGKGGRRVRLTTSITWYTTLCSLLDSLLTVKTDAICSSETSLGFQYTTWRYTTEDETTLSVSRLWRRMVSRLTNVVQLVAWNKNPYQRHCRPQIPLNLTRDRRRITSTHCLSDAWFAN